MYVVKSKWCSVDKRIIWLVIRNGAILGQYLNEFDAKRRCEAMKMVDDPWLVFARETANKEKYVYC
jgi:hypothetical protein